MIYSPEALCEIVDIGASELDTRTNSLLVSAKGPALSDDSADAEDYSRAPVFGALGLTSRPYPATPEGRCQGLAMRGHGNGIILNMRDTRTGSAWGSMDPGDTNLHSTGPNHFSRVVLKEDKRVAMLMTRDSEDNDIFLALNGEADEMSWVAFGMGIRISREQGIILQTGGGYIHLTPDGVIWLNGSQVLLGDTPTALAAGFSGGPVASTNVFVKV